METINLTQARLRKLQEVLAKITYKPGYTFSIDTETSKIRIKLRTKDCLRPDVDIDFLQVIKPQTVEKDFIQFVRRMLKDIELHELDEWIKYDGFRVFNPHEGVRQNEIARGYS